MVSKRRRERDAAKIDSHVANERSKARAEKWQNRATFNEEAKSSEVRRVEITPEMQAQYARALGTNPRAKR